MDDIEHTLAIGYRNRICELVVSMMDGCPSDQFAERGAAIMTALISETANCAASLAVTRGADPDVIASLVGANFSTMYSERLETLAGETATVQ